MPNVFKYLSNVQGYAASGTTQGPCVGVEIYGPNTGTVYWEWDIGSCPIPLFIGCPPGKGCVTLDSSYASFPYTICTSDFGSLQVTGTPASFEQIQEPNTCTQPSGSEGTMTYLNECGIQTTINCSYAYIDPFSEQPTGVINVYGYNLSGTNCNFSSIQSFTQYNKSTSSSMDLATICKGVMCLGIGSNQAYGPTNVTKYFAGLTPPTNGFTIYTVRDCGTYDVRTVSNTNELISISRQYGGTGNTLNDAINFFNNKINFLCVNKDYPAIVTNGLGYLIDPTFIPSYFSGTSFVNTLGRLNGWSGDPSTITTTNLNYSATSTGSWYVVNSGRISSTYSNANIGTIDMWLRTSGDTFQNTVIWETQNFSGITGGRLRISRPSETNSITISDGTNSNSRGSIFSNNTWVNVVVTFDGSNLRLYKNTVLQGSAISFTWSSNLSGFHYGGGSLASFEGLLGSLKIYSTALSATEISQNYTNYNPNNF